MNRVSSRTVWVAVAAGVAVLAAVAVGIVWGLASGGRSDLGTAPMLESGSPSLEPTPAASPSADGADRPAETVPPAGGDPEPDSGGTAEPTRGPKIEVFRIVQEPRCPGGTVVNPDEGQPVTLEWRVIGAPEVTISIDGGGIYAAYPAESSATYSFGCSGQEGDIQKHTYLLTAVGDGVTVTETLEVTATVHERVEV